MMKEDLNTDGTVAVPLKDSMISQSCHTKSREKAKLLVRSSTAHNRSSYGEEKMDPELSKKPAGSFVSNGQPQDRSNHASNDMVYENVTSHQPSEHSGRALLYERETQDSFNKAFNHME